MSGGTAHGSARRAVAASRLCFRPRIRIAMPHNREPDGFDAAAVVFTPCWSVRVAGGRDARFEPRSDDGAEAGFGFGVHHYGNFGPAGGVGENQAGVADAVEHGIGPDKFGREKDNLFHLLFLRMVTALFVPHRDGEGNGGDDTGGDDAGGDDTGGDDTGQAA